MSTGKPRLLLVGGSHADIPQILAARQLGYHVITSGNRAEDLGHRYADSVVLADYSDSAAMLQIAADNEVAGVCPGCNDFAALSAAFVAQQLKLPGHDTPEACATIHHKDRFRKFAADTGVPVPGAAGFTCVSDALAALGQFRLPLLVKPVDLTGGKGIARISEPAEARAALEHAFALSRAGRVVLEEFVEGSRHGFSCLLAGGKVVFHFSDDEHYYRNPFLVSGASFPGSASDPAVTTALCAAAERMAAALDLADGIFHVQYILPPDRQPVIIEVCRRPPGDLYTRFVQLATGLDYPSLIVRAFLGLPLEIEKTGKAYPWLTRHCIMAQACGKISDVVFSAGLDDNIVERMMWWRPGDDVGDFMTYKAGIVFVAYRDEQEYLSKSAVLPELVRIELEE